MEVRFVGRAAVVAAAFSVVGVLCSAAGAGVPGPNFWFDDFSDGNATNGDEPNWSPFPALPGDYRVQPDGSGGFNYVFTTVDPTPGSQDETLFASVEQGNNPGLNTTYGDMSIRTRGVLAPVIPNPDPNDPKTNLAEGNLLIGNRFEAATFSGYVAFIDHAKNFEILAVQFGDPSNTIATVDDAFGDPNNYDPNFALDALTDVVVQLDTFGNRIEATVWRPGDVQPEPQLKVTDFNITNPGTGGIGYDEDNEALNDSGVLNWAKAASIKLIDGDMDLDGDHDFDDIAGFVQGLTDPAGYETATGLPPVMMGDTDNDGDQDFDDISVFVAILQTPLTAAGQVPEPSTVALAVLGLVGLLAAGRRRV